MLRPNFNESMGKFSGKWMKIIYSTEFNGQNGNWWNCMILCCIKMHQTPWGFRMIWLKDGKEFKSSIGGIQNWRFLALALVNYDIWSCLKIENGNPKRINTHTCWMRGQLVSDKHKCRFHNNVCPSHTPKVSKKCWLKIMAYNQLQRAQSPFDGHRVCKLQ